MRRVHLPLVRRCRRREPGQQRAGVQKFVDVKLALEVAEDAALEIAQNARRVLPEARCRIGVGGERRPTTLMEQVLHATLQRSDEERSLGPRRKTLGNEATAGAARVAIFAAVRHANRLDVAVSVRDRLDGAVDVPNPSLRQRHRRPAGAAQVGDARRLQPLRGGPKSVGNRLAAFRVAFGVHLAFGERSPRGVLKAARDVALREPVRGCCGGAFGVVDELDGAEGRGGLALQ
mmetsp:Transcript_7342/g.25752  ORF Transcript_7342/g.25752 Transcript_7342/m.25752 type:complete len:233 (-) Transcript_7342:60-758(-)